ncbi:MAG: hypothetical protein M1815_003494 [Lichina confinis]|nr:MAG: hypothetical protein M1815_003494 [Lichina confinis]
MAEPQETIVSEDPVPPTTQTLKCPRERPGDQEDHVAGTTLPSDVATSQEADALPAKAAAASGTLEQRQDDRVDKENTHGNVPQKENDEGRQRRVEAIKARNEVLQKTLEDLRSQRDEVLGKVKNKSTVQQTIKGHIGLLHEYNAIRDIGTGLMGLIAERRGVRTLEVYDEFGLAVGD